MIFRRGAKHSRKSNSKNKPRPFNLKSKIPRFIANTIFITLVAGSCYVLLLFSTNAIFSIDVNTDRNNQMRMPVTVEQIVTYFENREEDEEGGDGTWKVELSGNDVDVTISGYQGEHTLVFVADAHLIADTAPNNQVSAVWLARQQGPGLTLDGSNFTVSPKDRFKSVANDIKAISPNALLLGGDLMDSATDASADYINSCLSGISAPTMHITTDHEFNIQDGRGSDGHSIAEKIRGSHENIDLGEVVLVHTDFMSLEAEIPDKPYIVVTHAPMEGGSGEAKAATLFRTDNNPDRHGKGYGIGPGMVWDYSGSNAQIQKFMNDPNCHLILAGHAHPTSSVILNPSSREDLWEIITAPAFYGNFLTIKIHGDGTSGRSGRQSGGTSRRRLPGNGTGTTYTPTGSGYFEGLDDVTDVVKDIAMAYETGWNGTYGSNGVDELYVGGGDAEYKLQYVPYNSFTANGKTLKPYTWDNITYYRCCNGMVSHVLQAFGAETTFRSPDYFKNTYGKDITSACTKFEDLQVGDVIANSDHVQIVVKVDSSYVYTAGAGGDKAIAKDADQGWDRKYLKTSSIASSTGEAGNKWRRP